MGWHKLQWEEIREEKNPRGTPKLWLRQQLYHWKDIDKTNPVTPIKVINGE
jgi:hypothetical protein